MHLKIINILLFLLRERLKWFRDLTKYRTFLWWLRYRCSYYIQVASERLLTNNLFRTSDFRLYKSSFIVITDRLGFPCYCSSGHKSAVVLWYSYIAATRYRTSGHVSERRENKNKRRTRRTETGKRERSGRWAKGIAVRRVDYRFCLPAGPSSSIDIRNSAEPAVELMQKSMNQ